MLRIDVTSQKDGKSLTLYIAEDALIYLCPPHTQHALEQDQRSNILQSLAAALCDTYGKSNNIIYLKSITFNSDQTDLITYVAHDKESIAAPKTEYISLSDEAPSSDTYQIEIATDTSNERAENILGKMLPIPLEDVVAENKLPTKAQYEAIIRSILDTKYQPDEAERLARKITLYVFGDAKRSLTNLAIEAERVNRSYLDAAGRYHRKATIRLMELKRDGDSDATEYTEALLNAFKTVLELHKKSMYLDISSESELISDNSTVIFDAINSYNAQRAEFNYLWKNIVAAIHNAAKDYYADIWKRHHSNKGKLNEEIANFNAIFGDFAKINDDYRIELLNEALGQPLSEFITRVNKLLNGTYDKHRYDYKTKQYHDAFSFLQRRLARLNKQEEKDEGEYFNPVVRQKTNHAFEFNQATKELIHEYNVAKQALDQLSVEQLDQFLKVAENAEDTIADRSNEIKNKLKVVENNIPAFNRFLERKDRLDERIERILDSAEYLDSELLPLNIETLDIPEWLRDGVAELYITFGRELRDELYNQLTVAKEVLAATHLQLETLVEEAKQAADSFTILDYHKKISLFNNKVSEVEGLIQEVANNLPHYNEKIADFKALVEHIEDINSTSKGLVVFKNNYLNYNNDLVAGFHYKQSIDELCHAATQHYNKAAIALQRNPALRSSRHLQENHHIVEEVLGDEGQLPQHIFKDAERVINETDDLAQQIEDQKIKTTNFLLCQMLVNRIMRFEDWNSKRNPRSISDKKFNYYNVPNEIADLANIIYDSNFTAEANPETAEALLNQMRAYAEGKRSFNGGVNALLKGIRSEPANYDPTDVLGIRDILDRKSPVMRHRARNRSNEIIGADLLQPRESFWQRHSTWKKALIGGAIGLGVAVLGAALITAFVFTGGAAAIGIAVGVAVVAGAGIGGGIGAIVDKIQQKRNRPPAGYEALPQDDFDSVDRFVRSEIAEEELFLEQPIVVNRRSSGGPPSPPRVEKGKQEAKARRRTVKKSEPSQLGKFGQRPKRDKDTGGKEPTRNRGFSHHNKNK